MSDPPQDGQDTHMLEDLGYDKGVGGKLSQERHGQGYKLDHILHANTLLSSARHFLCMKYSLHIYF